MDYGNFLWNTLNTLVDKEVDGIFRRDVVHTDGNRYVLFGYHYIDWSIVEEINNIVGRNFFDYRGVLFRLNDDNTGELVSLPFEKFFNLNENPITTNVDLSKTVEISEKADGSLISTFINGNGEVDVKSRTSLESSQAVAAYELLHENDRLLKEVQDLELLGYTVIFEYVSPKNRIVVHYPDDRLIVLAVRNRLTGEYIPLDELTNYRELRNHAIRKVECENVIEFINSISTIEGIEGYVLLLEDGLRIKVKTQWYLERHRLRDNLTNPRNLGLAIINQKIDDLRTILSDDKDNLAIIEHNEHKVREIYHYVSTNVENFYQENKKLSRKDYAIKGQKEHREIFPVLMQRYTNDDVDYSRFVEQVINKSSYEDYVDYVDGKINVEQLLFKLTNG